MNIFFTSSFLPNKQYTTFNSLFEDLLPNKMLLVFDTNLVILFREFYLNPKFFIQKHRPEELEIVKYLIENISKYNIETDVTLGVDESSRKKKDFSKISTKWEQTHNALSLLLSVDVYSEKDLNLFIENKKIEEPIKDDSIFPETAFFLLKENKDCFYINHLIAAYLSNLKIIYLFNLVEKQEITAKEALMNFYTFMKEEIDILIARSLQLAIFIFGGLDEYKNIIFPKANDPFNKKINKILNGAVDILYPTLVDSFPNHKRKKGVFELKPVFVTADKRISKLHSLTSTKAFFGDKSQINYMPEVMQFNYPKELKLTENDLSSFQDLFIKDAIYRYSNKQYGKGRDTSFLLDKCSDYEVLLKKNWSNNN